MRFSKQNGFGPVEEPPTLHTLHTIHTQLRPGTHDYLAYRDGIELHDLLSNATAAELAAVQQIAIAMHITRLKGSIGSRGNTSCLLQESTLGLILPHLPDECSVIIVKRRTTSSRMKSTKYKRHNIQRMLELLKKNNHPAWKDIQISYDHLQAWDEDGDLADTLSRTQNNIIIETDENGDEVTADIYEQQRQGEPNDVEVLNDGGDTGPAELQNNEIDEQTYEGVVQFQETSNVGLENAIHAAAAVNTAVDEIINAANVAVDGDGPAQLRGGSNVSVTEQSHSPPLATLNNQGTSATLNQHEIVTTIGYADMLQRDWAFSQAFPSLFIPRYCLINGTWGWHIFHDYKGWDKHRDKDVDFNSWLQLQIWRSDGEPAAHGTFALIAINIKMKTALVKQGHYVVQVSGMDIATTAQEIADAQNEDQLKKQMDDLVNR